MTAETVRCPACEAELPSGSRFCSSCGQVVAARSQMVTTPAAAEAMPAGVARLISSDSVSVGGLAPGASLADRYRIIGLLGRGGMGEVYRADDLKLGQPVALKFLPAALAGDPVRRERFFAEVRITRQLSHPNICRVYDIADAGGRHFLSMEFIDGEDLASLLQRIGYLSNEKALDIARQLVAGLAAAHERGVLHRDLKPANIMLDGRGRVRITDFGLAVAASDEAAAADASGTPAYMAPEQLAGQGATVRSDIYALGLVLYELYTGKRAFKAPSLPELRAQKEGATPSAPSELRQGIDPVVERVIARCMERDPRQRPASVALIAAALPGGDPLAAAIAAGETPSPELVAASGLREGLRPAAAVALLAFVVAGSVAAIAMNSRAMIIGQIPFEKTPDVLVERAHEVLGNLGHPTPRVDSAFGITLDGDVQRYLQQEPSDRRWKDSASSLVVFWYRQSPRALERVEYSLPMAGGVSDSDPPVQFPGESLIRLDTEGRLRSLEMVPPPLESLSATSAPDWARLFDEAGLDISAWTPTAPQRLPFYYADTQAAWTGTLPTAPNVSLRIEAAAYRGRPVSFHIVGPWTPSSLLAAPGPTRGQKAGATILLLLLVALIAGSAFFAHRNLRLGRGDRRGAARVAALSAGLGAIPWILSEHHVAGLWEAYLILMFVGWTMFVGGFAWVAYIALEPFVRRRWPGMLVSWTRLLGGDWRDPLVGRDALIACAAGTALACFVRLSHFLPVWLGYPEPPPIYGFITPNPLLGTSAFVSLLAGFLSNEILFGLLSLFLFLLLTTLLRRTWAAAAMFVAVLAVPDALTIPASPLWVIVVVGVLAYALMLFVLWRFGLVALILSWFIYQIFMRYPMTFQTSAWYASLGYSALLVVAAIAIYGFRTSLGGRRLFDSMGAGADALEPGR